MRNYFQEFIESLKCNLTILGTLMVLFTLNTNAATFNGKNADSIPIFTIDQCIAYAMDHHPLVLSSQINIAIARKNNQINLSGWLPQVGLDATFYHYPSLPTSFSENQALPNAPIVPVKTGISNSATPQFSATETFFSPN